MIIDELPDYQYSPSKISFYLENNGWRLHKKINNLLSIWEKQVNQKTYKALLPLDRKLGDFIIKMDEFFTLLSKIEDRPKEDIIKACQISSYLAEKSQREILDIRVYSHLENKQEVSLDGIGSIFKSLQELFYEVGNEVGGFFVGKISIKEELKLYFSDVYKGSFGIRILSPKARQLNLFDPPLIESSFDRLIELIKIANIEDLESLESQMEAIDHKLLIKLKSLMNGFLKLNSDVFINWGSVNKNKGADVELSIANITRLLDMIKKQKFETEISVSKLGRLILAGTGSIKKSRKFIFTPLDEDDDIVGTISKELAELLKNETSENIFNGLYRASLIVKTKIKSSGETQIEYILNSIQIHNS
jgi:hypothetical protein